MKLANSSVFLRLAAIAAMIATLSAGALGCTAQTEDAPEAQAMPMAQAAPATTKSVVTADTTDPSQETRTIDVKAGDPLLDVQTARGNTLGGVLSRNGLTMADLGTVLANEANAGMIAPRCSVVVSKAQMATIVGDALDAGTDAGALRGSTAFYGLTCLAGSLEYRVTKDGDLTIPVHGRADLGNQLVGTKSGLATLGEQVGVLVGKVDQVTQASNATNARLDDLHRTTLAAARADADRWNKLIGSALVLALLAIIGCVGFLFWRKRNMAKGHDTVVTKEEIAAIVNDAIRASTDKRPTQTELSEAVTRAAQQAAARTLTGVAPTSIAEHAAQAAALALKPTLDANTAALDAGRRREEALAAALAQTQASMRELATSIDHAAQLNADLNHQQDDLNRAAKKVRDREAAVTQQEVTVMKREVAVTERETACALREARPAVIQSVVPTLCPPADDAAMSAVVQTYSGIGPTAPLPAITEDYADDRTQVRAALPLTGADDAEPPTLGAEEVASANTGDLEPAADHDGNGSNGAAHTIEDAATVDYAGSSEGASHVRPANGHGGNGHATTTPTKRREAITPDIVDIGDNKTFVCMSCRATLEGTSARNAHEAMTHYQCSVCVDHPMFVDLGPWMDHCLSTHPPDTDGDNGNGSGHDDKAPQPTHTTDDVSTTAAALAAAEHDEVLALGT